MEEIIEKGLSKQDIIDRVEELREEYKDDKAKLQQESTFVETGLSQLHRIKDTIKQAKVRVAQIQTPIKQTNNFILEIVNLNKLLEREINLLNNSGSAQIRKNTKLMQIISCKMTAVNSQLSKYLLQVNNNQNEAQAILNELTEDFAPSDSADT